MNGETGEVLPWSRDWEQLMPDAKSHLPYYDDRLKLDLERRIQAMEGDSVATVINRSFCLRADRSNRAESTRNDPDKKGIRKKMKYVFSWEHLKDVKLPSKTWDDVVSHTSTPRKEGDSNVSDDQTTLSKRAGRGMSFFGNLPHVQVGEESTTTRRRTKEQL